MQKEPHYMELRYPQIEYGCFEHCIYAMTSLDLAQFILHSPNTQLAWRKGVAKFNKRSLTKGDRTDLWEAIGEGMDVKTRLRTMKFSGDLRVCDLPFTQDGNLGKVSVVVPGASAI